MRTLHLSITLLTIAVVLVAASIALLVTYRVPTTQSSKTHYLTLPSATLASLRARDPSAIVPTTLASNGTLGYYNKGSLWTTQPSNVAAARGPNHVDGVAVTLEGANSAIYTTSQVQNYNTFGVSMWIKVLSGFTGPEAVVSTRPGSRGALGITLSVGTPGGVPTCTLGFGIDGPGIWIGRATAQSLCSGQWTYVAAFWISTAGKPVNPSQFSLFINGELAPSSPYIYKPSHVVISPIPGNGFLTIGSNAGGWASPDAFSFTDLTSYTGLTASTSQIISAPCCRARGR